MDRVDFSTLRLKKVGSGKGRMYNGLDFVVANYDICMVVKGREKRIGIIDAYTFSNGLKYINNWKINANMRGQGIGTYILKKYFRGYYLYNGNDRVKSLYNRLGKPQSEFSTKENKKYIEAFASNGLFKIR